MPRAYPPPDADLYALDIDERRTELVQIVEGQKWLVDLMALLALNAGVTAIFIHFLQRAFQSGLTIQSAGGLLASFVLCWLLFTPSLNAINLGAEMVLLKIRAWAHIPYGLEERHLLLHALWRAIVNTIYAAATWGVGFFLAEFLKSGTLGG